MCHVSDGRIVTLANLRRIGQFLVDIQGQNDHQELMHPESHLRLLDSFGDSAFQEIKTTYQIAYREYVTLAKQVKKFKQNGAVLLSTDRYVDLPARRNR